jgi:hypothetical protein
VVDRVLGGEEDTHPSPVRSGEAEAERERVPVQRAVPELWPNHGGWPSAEWTRWSILGGINRLPDVGFFSGVPVRSEAMGVLGKLRKVGNYVRKGWQSTGPNSYSQYKRGRERQRKQAEWGREEADRSAELGREEVRRGREYEERYAAERAAETPQTEPPRDDRGKPE